MTLMKHISLLAVGAQIALVTGCGKIKEDEKVDMIDDPICTESGKMPKATAPCCSSQKDSKGLCCSGDACKEPPKLPDLTFSSNSIYLSGYPGIRQAYVCLNKRPDGTPENNNNFVKVTNNGGEYADPYEVAFGLYHQPSGNVYPCDSRLNESRGTRPGYSSVWEGPYCCLIIAPGGTYNFFAYADPKEVVKESDEKNNAVVSTTTVTIRN